MSQQTSIHTQVGQWQRKQQSSIACADMLKHMKAAMQVHHHMLAHFLHDSNVMIFVRWYLASSLKTSPESVQHSDQRSTCTCMWITADVSNTTSEYIVALDWGCLGGQIGRCLGCQIATRLTSRKLLSSHFVLRSHLRLCSGLSKGDNARLGCKTNHHSFVARLSCKSK